MGGFDHALQIADAAAVFVLGLLGGLVFEILAQVPEGAGTLDLFNEAGHELEPAVIQLLLHLFDVFSCQFIVHIVLASSFRLASARRGESSLTPLLVLSNAK